MNELINSLAEAVRKRSSSAALGTYTFFWLAFHWQAIYVTLFVGQNYIYLKYKLLKNEYVAKEFFKYSLFSHHGFLPYLWGFVEPLILTILFIWLIQKYALYFAFNEEQQNKTKRRKVRLREERKIIEYEKGLAEDKTAAIDAEIILTEKTREAEKIDPAIVWAQDFEEFKKDPAFNGFSLIISSIYENGGHTRRYYDREGSGWVDFEVPKGILALADSNNLITIDNKTRTIELTEKGKYFVKRFPQGR